MTISAQSILTFKSAATTGGYRITGATTSLLGNVGSADVPTVSGYRITGRHVKVNRTSKTSGTISVTNGSPTVTGTSTSFTTEYTVGDYLEIENQPGTHYIISVIGSNTSITLTTNFTGSTNASTHIYAKVLTIAWDGQTLYSWSGGAWTARKTLSPATSGENCHSGLYVVNISGTPTVCGLYIDNSGFARGIKTTDGITWTTTAAMQGQGAPSMAAEVWFNNVFYWCGSSNNSPGSASIGHISWDPTTDTGSASNPSQMSDKGHDFCGYAGLLYKIAYRATGTTTTQGYWLWVLSAGVFTPIVRLPANTSSADSVATHRPALWDGGNGKLYAMYYTTAGGNTGFYVAEITPSGLSSTATDISSTVLPSALQYPNNPAGASTTGIHAFVEMESDTTTPNIHIFIASAVSGTAWGWYKWNGNAALIGNGGVSNDSGGDVSMGIPTIKNGSAHIWAPNTATAGVAPTSFDVEITSWVSITNGIRFSFRMKGVTGVETKSFGLWFFTSDGIPTSRGTLSNPSAGSLSGGNTVNGLTCDGNTANPTTYTVDWLANTDGIASNQTVRVAPRAF